MFFTHYKLKQALPTLTIEDFEFDRSLSSLGYINMREIEIKERIMSICGKTNILIDIPYATIHTSTPWWCQFYHPSLQHYHSCSEEQYNEYKEKYKNIDTLQINVFVLEAKLKNEGIHELIRQYNRKHNFSNYACVSENFKYINYNFEHFISGNKHFTEDDIKEFFYKIKEYYKIQIPF